MIEADGRLYFVGADDIYSFDTATVSPIYTQPIRSWMWGQTTTQELRKAKLAFDKRARRIAVHFPRHGELVCDECIVYHLDTKKWGRVPRKVRAVMTYASAGTAIDSVSSFIDDVETVFDSVTWEPSESVPAVFNESGNLQTYTGPYLDSYMVSQDIGDDVALSMLRDVRCRFMRKPDTASVETMTSDESGGSFSVKHSGSMLEGRAPVHQTGRWHRVKVAFKGAARVIGLATDLVQVGARTRIDPALLAIIKGAPKANVGSNDHWIVDFGGVTLTL